MNQSGNLLANLPADLPEEFVSTLVRTGTVRIQRIVSLGHVSPPDFWYDQDQNEWVVLLCGAAQLQLEDRVLDLRPGDWVHIVAHQRHRVAWTVPNAPTVWLAVHFE